MTVGVDDPWAWPMAQALLDCVCTEMALTVGGPVCECELMPGQLYPMDFCLCSEEGCGMAFVQVDSVFPSLSLPQQTITQANCVTPLAIEFKVGAFRCVPTLHPDGTPPSAEENAEAVRVQLSDMWALYKAMRCCASDDENIVIGRYQPLGPAGNCGGGYWNMWARLGMP